MLDKLCSSNFLSFFMLSLTTSMLFGEDPVGQSTNLLSPTQQLEEMYNELARLSDSELKSTLEQGQWVAAFILGHRYETEDGSLEGLVKAAELLEEGAINGDPRCQLKFGLRFFPGNGDKQDPELGAAWIRKAADQELAHAQMLMGIIYRDGIGVEKNSTKSFVWNLKAAQQGFAQAQNEVGMAYLNGIGVERNHSLAFQWWEKAAAQNDSMAQNNLGTCFENGIGAKQNPEAASHWYRMAASQGLAIAQNNLGICYARGFGVPQNNDIAIAWFEKASAQGNEGAADNLRHIRTLIAAAARTRLEEATRRYQENLRQYQQRVRPDASVQEETRRFMRDYHHRLGQY